MLLRPGDNFAGCRILSLCGSGGMGVVYLAQDAVGRTVALKIVPLCDFQRELTGIRRYIEAASGQPDLIQIFHAGIERDCLFYIMEAADNLNPSGPYVPKTLSALLARDGKIIPSEALELIRNLAGGLQVLHRSELIHRDIKPENIIFVQGVPKLCDPGLVCSMDATASLVGTLGYLPPECFNGQNLNTPGRDLYALGKVFYAAVTGEPPSRYPHIPTDLPLSVRRIIWPLLTRACSVNPKHRFQNTGDFCRALPSELPDPGPAERALNAFRQWRLANPGAMTSLVLVFLLTVVLCGCAFAWQLRRQWKRAEFLLQCQHQCDAVSVRYLDRKTLLLDQLAGLAGEAEAKRVEQILKTLPDDPAERLAVYKKLDSELEKLFRSTLLPVPEQASEADFYRISDRNRSLLASPLAAWLPDRERKTLESKLAKLEKRVLPVEVKLRPGQTFKPDSSFRSKFIYVPSGVFRRKNGQLIRIPYGFWCCDGELRADLFRPPMGWIKNSEQPGMPMGRFTWNDLLEYCRLETVHFQRSGMIPSGFIVRPLTVSEWQWACRGAWSGTGNATAFLKENSGGRIRPVRSGKPNSLGLYDFIGNVAEIIIPDSGLDSNHRVAFCGGWYANPARRVDPEKPTGYLKYQWLPPHIGARIAIVPGSMEFFNRALWLTGPRETTFRGRRYELFATNHVIMPQEAALQLCRLLGGHLLAPESAEQLTELRKAFPETGTFPVVIDGVLKDGVWLRPDGTPYRGVPLPAIPKHPTWIFAFHRGRIICHPLNRCAGLICEWNEAEYRRREDPDRIRRSGVFLHTFRIGSTEYLLVPCPVYPHMARRVAQLLGAKLAQPRNEAVRERFLQELEPWKDLTVMLGGHWKYGRWALDDGSTLDLKLPPGPATLTESLNMSSPGLFDGKFCALQRTQAFLLELPLE